MSAATLLEREPPGAGGGDGGRGWGGHGRGGGDDEPEPRHNSSGPPRGLVVALAVTLVALVLAATGVVAGGAQAEPTTAEIMRLSVVPDVQAPGFTLTDQAGRTVSLASLRGRAVALCFLDPRFPDVGAVVAREFVAADGRLGEAARRVAFVGIDVNPHATARRWLQRFDAGHGLDHIPNWYFLTGSRSHLSRVWADYAVRVQTTGAGILRHTSLIEFIAADGRERAVAIPFAETLRGRAGSLSRGEIDRWGRGIAHELRTLI